MDIEIDNEKHINREPEVSILIQCLEAIQKSEVRKSFAKLDNTIKCFHNAEAEADHEEDQQEDSPYFVKFIAMIF